MTAPDGLLRDAGGARPTSDVVNHCVDCCCARSWSALGVTEYDGKSIPEHITRLRDSEALARGKIAEQMIEIERLKANQRCSAIEQGDVGYPCVFRAEAEARIAALEAERDAALSARESIEEFSHAKTDEILRLSADNELWQDRCLALQTERDALAKDAELLQAMAAEWNQNRRGVRYAGMPIWDALCEAVGDDADGTAMRAAIDAARSKP